MMVVLGSVRCKKIKFNFFCFFFLEGGVQILTLVVLPSDLYDFCLLIKSHNNNEIMQNLDLWGHIFVVIS